jgi:xylitol oxidase
VTAGTNWAGNHVYRASEVRVPRSVEELQELVRESPALRALGTRHCFNDIADTSGVLVSLAEMPTRAEIDESRSTVTVNAGARYGELAGALEGSGWALGNLASLPHISVAGAVATGTHGSGVGNGSLATAVTAVELVDAEGDLHRFARDEDPEFPGTVVALGALGIVTSLDLRIEPSYEVAQTVFERLPLDTALANFEAIMGAGYSVSMFTRWRDEVIDQIWVKRRSEDPELGEDLFGARPAPENRHPIPGMPSINSTVQLGVPGPWAARLPHFKMDFTPSAGEELQTEYLLPFRSAVPALDAVRGLADRIAPLLQTSELRTVQRDDLWLSPAYEQDCVALHFTWVQDVPAVSALLPALEAAIEPFGARPHWGKLFTMKAERIAQLYDRLPDFVRLAERLDARGAFRNDYLERVVFSAG